MSISIKKLAACIGIDGGFSVVEDFFGYVFHGHQRASLRTQAQLLAAPHVNVNMIRVGEENFEDEDKAKIDGAVERMRELYAQVPIGVGRVLHWVIDEADARESDVWNSVPLDDGAPRTLTNDWNAPNDDLDVFLVLSWSPDRPGKKGQAPIEGSCDKDGGICDNSTGAVFSLAPEARTIGTIMAHEVGHYLGLDHIGDLDGDDVDEDEDGVVDPEFQPFIDNLMFPIVTKVGTIEPWQGVIMAAHCLIRPGCRS